MSCLTPLLLIMFWGLSKCLAAMSAQQLIDVQRSLDALQRNINGRYKCNTSWMQAYTAQHKQLTPLRRLVHVPFLSGLADRIIGFVTSTAFAVLSNRAIQSGKRPPLPPLEGFFTSPYVNWTRDYDEDWLLDDLFLMEAA